MKKLTKIYILTFIIIILFGSSIFLLNNKSNHPTSFSNASVIKIDTSHKDLPKPDVTTPSENKTNESTPNTTEPSNNTNNNKPNDTQINNKYNASSIDELLAKMSLEEKIGQMLIIE